MKDNYLYIDAIAWEDGTFHLGDIQFHDKTVASDEIGTFVFRGIRIEIFIFEVTIGLKTYL